MRVVREENVINGGRVVGGGELTCGCTRGLWMRCGKLHPRCVNAECCSSSDLPPHRHQRIMHVSMLAAADAF